MPIKLIITDLDDTLLRSDATISQRCERVLGSARALGAELVLASGRMTRAMRPYAAQLRVTAPMISYNGAEISDPVTGKLIDALPVPAETARQVCAMAEGMGLHMQAYFDDEFYSEAENEFSLKYAAAIGVPGRVAGQRLSTFIDRDCAKLLLIDTPERVKRLIPMFCEAFGTVLNCASSRPHYIEFTSMDATKGNALNRLAQSMGIAPDEIVAFGDGQNDLSMLKYAALGYAPANARPEVLAQAPMRMPSNDEDGVAWAIESLMEQGLIGGR